MLETPAPPPPPPLPVEGLGSLRSFVQPKGKHLSIPGLVLGLERLAQGTLKPQSPETGLGLYGLFLYPKPKAQMGSFKINSELGIRVQSLG